MKVNRAVLLQEAKTLVRKRLVGTFQGDAIRRMADAQSVNRPVIDQARYRGDRAENPRLFANNPIANTVSVMA